MLLLVVAVAGCTYKVLHKRLQKTQLRLDQIRAKYALARKVVQQARAIQNEVEEQMDEDEDEGAFQATLDTLKVIIGNLQIITQLPGTLKFSCSVCKRFREMVSSLPAINLDVMRSFKADCVEGMRVDLYMRFVFFVVSPVLVGLVLWLWSRSTAGKGVRVEQSEDSEHSDKQDPDGGPATKSRKAKARELMFWLIFLMYPTVTRQIFEVFQCRELDFGHSWHVFDPSVDCTGSGYAVLRLFGLVFLFIYPFGIPALFGFLLFKNRAALRLRPPNDFSFPVFTSTVRTVLGRDQKTLNDEDLREIWDEIDADASGEVSSEELWTYALHHAVRDRQLLDDAQPPSAEEVRPSELTDAGTSEHSKWYQGLGKDELKFLVRAYEPKYFWFELVTYLKKFILSGVLVFAEPGSTAQLYVGCVVSFFFFAVQCRAMPFKNPKTDISAAVAEANREMQIFIRFACTRIANPRVSMLQCS